MKKPILVVAFVVSLAASLATAEAAQAVDAEKTVKVFILAGQSNMEGKAANTLLDHQATDPKTKELFAHLRKDDKWAVRDDDRPLVIGDPMALACLDHKSLNSSYHSVPAWVHSLV